MAAPRLAPRAASRRPLRRSPCRSARHARKTVARAVAEPLQVYSARELDLGSGVVLYGVSHLDAAPGPAERVASLAESGELHCVLVETALNDAHAAAWGNALSYQEEMMFASECPLLANFTRAAYQLKKELDEGGLKSVMDAPTWGVMAQQLPGEQLAYVAALATGAPLVYGDRPKHVTYQRMMRMGSAAELDNTFARQQALYLLEAFPEGERVGLEPGGYDGDLFERFVIRERDVCMAEALRAAAAQAGGRAVVGVVGEDHLDGIAALWEGSGGLPGELLEAPEEEVGPFGMMPEEAVEHGVKRALLERVLGLRCSAEVIQDAQAALGDLPEGAEEAYAQTLETYVTPRMTLAVLDDPLLDLAVARLQDKGSFSAELEALRQLRPANGGPGYDAEALGKLRMLNYMFP